MTDVVDSVTQSLPVSDTQKQQISEGASRVKEQLSGQVTSQVGARASQAGEQVTSVAQALRTTGEQLEGQGQDAPAKVMHTAADKAEELGQYLTTSDPNQILADVEQLCREQPWVVIAGGLAIGFLAARFLKASSSRRYEQRYTTGAPYYTDGYRTQVYAETETGGVAYRQGGI